MKRKMQWSMILATAAALMAIPAVSRAQEQAPAPPPAGQGDTPMHHGGMHGDMVQNRMQVMVQSLNLTDEQKAQLKPILEDANTKIAALRSDTSLTTQQKRQQVMEIHKDTHSKISGMLTPEQKEKWDKMGNEGMEHHGGMMKGLQPPAGSAPPSQP